MKHLGDVTKISGYEVPPVDCVIGGSPCQDLSVAGKRAGLAGERSGLFMEQIRIIKEMREHDRNSGRTDVFVRPRYMVWENVCFSAGTLVACDSGYKNIEDVAIGDKVKTLSGEYHPVAACYKTPKVEVMNVKASGSEPLTVTTNHPFWAREKSYAVNGQREYGAPQWVEAGKLTKNHMIAYRLDIPTLPDDFISTDVAWALGRWLADGSVDLNRSNPRIFISCGKSKVDATRERLNKLPYEIYENSPHSTAVNFSFTSFEFYRLIESAGKGAGNKKVPPFVFELPVGLQKSFLDGYLSGDGYSRCRNGSIEFSASTASRELAYGIARVFRNVYHAQATVSRHKAKEGTIGGRKIHANYPSYSIGAVINGKCQRWFYEDGVIWAPVISVERNGETANVYNLSVIGDNTYGANDIMVHNCGAFSSNKGEDFRAVLEETIRIAEPDAPDVPLPPKGKWPLADAYYGEGWSVAYRVLDAQFWGVPQRRRRIALVADFGGQSAPEILFVRKGVCGDSETSGEAWKGATAGTGTGAYQASLVRMREGCAGGGKGPLIQNERSGTLGCNNDQVLFEYPPVARSLTERYDGSPCIDRGPNIIVQDGVNCLTPWDTQSARVYGEDGSWHSLNANENGGMSRDAVLCLQGNAVDRSVGQNGSGVSYEPMFTLNATDRHAVLYENHPADSRVTGPHEVCPTASARWGTGGNNTPLVMATGQANAEITQNKSPTLNCNHEAPIVAELGSHEKGNEIGNQILRILQEALGEEAVFKWGIGVLDAIQQEKVLRQDVHGKWVQGERTQGDKLDDASLPCKELVAEWVLRDMRLEQECRCASQGREPAEQLNRELAEIMPKLSHKSAQDAQSLFDMWKAGKGIRLLREALSAVQKVRRPATVQEELIRHTASKVRRLTPLETERLQGYPDGWTDIGEWTDSKGKKHQTSDAARYKALGNSIALPPWKWVLKRLCACYERDATMASLFDGIAGFPYLWEQLNGKGSSLWASEVDEFCIAVTKKRFN